MKDVIRHSDKRCSYRCPYYLDGSVLSMCVKYDVQLQYDGSIPPLLADACKGAITNANPCA